MFTKHEQGELMNKKFRVQCTIDVGGEYSAEGAVETLAKIIKIDGYDWEVDNVQVIAVEELTNEEI
jgi:hypothetical protein